MRDRAKSKVGVVVSDKMQKTVVVSVERRMMDKAYKKVVKKVRVFKAHDEKNECKVGDRVEIVEMRPISREKRWRVQKVITRGEFVETPAL